MKLSASRDSSKSSETPITWFDELLNRSCSSGTERQATLDTVKAEVSAANDRRASKCTDRPKISISTATAAPFSRVKMKMGTKILRPGEGIEWN